MNFPPPTEKQARIIWFSVTALAVAALLTVGAGVVWGLGKVLALLAPVIWPLAVAGVLACLLDPLVDFLVRKKVPRTRAIVAVFVLALMIVAGLLASVVPQLVVETRQLAARMPAYKARLQQHAEKLISHPPALIQKYFLRQPAATEEPASSAPEAGTTNAPGAIMDSTNISPLSAPPPTTLPTLDKSNFTSATDWLARALPAVSNWLSQAVGIIASVFGVIAGLALVPIYAFYFLLEKHGISAQWRNYLPVRDSKFKDELVFVIGAINGYLVAFFRGQVLVAMCDGVLYTIGFLIIGLPYAVLIGVMATCLTIIPFLGAITTCVVSLVIALVAFGDWQHPLLVVAVFGVVQALEGTLIQPKIMGERVGLHPVTIIIALMVGTTLLGGILGGILAIPLTAALRVIMFRYVWKKRAA